MIWAPLANPILFQWTMSLVHFVWQGALIWLIWRGTTAYARRPETRYAMGVAALACMSACPIVTASLTPTMPRAELAENFVVGVPINESNSRAASTESDTLIAAAHWSSTLNFIQQLQPALLAVWSLGVVLLGGRLCVAYAATLWLRSEGARLERPIQNIANQIGRRLGFLRTPPIGVSTRIAEAMTLGVFQPMVLLPAAWLTELSPNVLEAVIAHELSHVRRGDLWVNAAQRVVETLLFYHPAVWFISRQIRVEREFCCDELAILATGRRVQYAQSLELVARRSMNPPVAAFAASFLGDRTMTLLQRVRHALGIPLGRESGRLLPVGLALLIVPAGLWIATAMLASPRVMAEDGPPRREGEFRPEGEFDPPPRRHFRENGPPPRRDGDFGPPPPRYRGGDFKPPPHEIIELLREEMRLLRGQIDRIQDRLDQLQGPMPRHRGERMRRNGDRPRREGPRDGDRARPEGLRDGDRPRREGPRDGDRPRPEGPRDGDRPKPEGPRDGDLAPTPKLQADS
ncbi:MAG: M56 family metallopeptidase [Blastopirellula sp. JB062]